MRRTILTSTPAAVAVALAAAGCALGEGTKELTASSGAAVTRGADPLTVTAPLFQVSLVGVTTITQANQMVPVTTIPPPYGETGDGSVTFEPADQLRVQIAARIETNGEIKPAAPDIGCLFGEWVPDGKGEGNYFTLPGKTYSTCQPDPAYPDTDPVGGPLMFAEPISVGMGEKLDLYTQLQVMNSGDVIAPASDPNASIGGAIAALGQVVGTLGTVASVAAGDLGTLAQAAGAVLTTAGQLLEPAPQAAGVACVVVSSLIPGFAPNAPTDNPANLLRTQLTGKQLWDATSEGDAIVGYDLDWGTLKPTSLCARPHTKLSFRVRRVTMFGQPGTPPVEASSMVTSMYPDQSDAFGVGSSGVTLHDHRANDLWTAGNAVPYQVRFTVKLPAAESGAITPILPIGWHDIFPANANIAGVSRSPNEEDLFAVDVNGNIVTTTSVGSGAWGAWQSLTTGGLFPPGAPVTAVARYPTHLDVFAAANDGSIRTVWWDQNGGWRAQFPVSPAGAVTAYFGGESGNLAAVSRINDAIDVFAVGTNWQVSDAYWTPPRGWQWVPQITPRGGQQSVPGIPIAAVSRDASHMDVFWTSENQNIVTIEWSGSSWSPAVSQVTSSNYPLSYVAPVAAVARRVNVTGDPTIDNQHMDVFTVDATGRVLHVPWTYGYDNDMWSPVNTEVLPITASSTGSISAFAPYAGSIQVVAKKTDGTLAHAWFEDVQAGQPVWQSVP